MAGLALADLGADVVKVERPGRGDPFRNFGLTRNGVSAFWLNVNRGKRSIQLDLTLDDGRDRFLRLVAASDVVIQNSRPGVAEALGVGDDVLAATNQRAIRLAITGFGSTGPRAAEPVFDSVVQALSGLAHAQGHPGRPHTVATAIIDKCTALVAVQAVLAALVERSATKRGRRVEVAMLDVAAYFNFVDLFQSRTFLADDRRIPPTRSPVVKTSDGHIVVTPVSGRQIGRTAEAMGHPEWKDELKATGGAGNPIERLLELVESATQHLPTEEALGRLRAHDVPAAPVHDLDDHLVDAQVLHNDLYSSSSSPIVGPVRVVRHPALFDGTPQLPRFTLPRAGEHEAEVFEEWQA